MKDEFEGLQEYLESAFRSDFPKMTGCSYERKGRSRYITFNSDFKIIENNSHD